MVFTVGEIMRRASIIKILAVVISVVVLVSGFYFYLNQKNDVHMPENPFPVTDIIYEPESNLLFINTLAWQKADWNLYGVGLIIYNVTSGKTNIKNSTNGLGGNIISEMMIDRENKRLFMIVYSITGTPGVTIYDIKNDTFTQINTTIGLSGGMVYDSNNERVYTSAFYFDLENMSTAPRTMLNISTGVNTTSGCPVGFNKETNELYMVGIRSNDFSDNSTYIVKYNATSRTSLKIELPIGAHTRPRPIYNNKFEKIFMVDYRTECRLLEYNIKTDEFKHVYTFDGDARFGLKSFRMWSFEDEIVVSRAGWGRSATFIYNITEKTILKKENVSFGAIDKDPISGDYFIGDYNIYRYTPYTNQKELLVKLQ